MRLHFPDYVLDCNLLNAIKNKQNGYVEGALTSDPCISSYFYWSKETDWPSFGVGLMTGLFKCKVQIVMPLIGYALLFSNTKVMSILIKRYNCQINVPVYIGDCRSPNKDWMNNHTIFEMPILALTSPEQLGFAHAINYDLNLSNSMTLVEVIHSFEHSVTNTHIFNNAWELAWSMWPIFKQPNVICSMTSWLLWYGLNASLILRSVDVTKLFVEVFNYNMKTEAFTNKMSKLLACKFLELFLIYCNDIVDDVILVNLYSALVRLINHKESDPTVHQAVVDIGIGYLSIVRKMRVLLHRHPVSILVEISRSVNTDSLAYICIRAFRQVCAGREFAKCVSLLKVPNAIKQQLYTAVLPNEATEGKSSTSIVNPFNIIPNHLKKNKRKK